MNIGIGGEKREHLFWIEKQIIVLFISACGDIKSCH
jgi:hypothetical protein